MKHIKLLLLFFLIIFSSTKLFALDSIVDELKVGGKIIMIRHAYAPGSGDPEKFSIKDCSTQRNLSKKGIEQSKSIGDFFKKNNIPIDIVLSSEWCRCKDTAFHAFKDYKTKSFLNSFYDIRFQNNKNRQLSQLKDFIRQWKGNKNLILITHYVVISEILNASLSSGELIIIDAEFNIIGNLESKL